MNRLIALCALAFICTCLLLICTQRSARCETKTSTSAFNERIQTLLRLEGQPFFDERDKLVREWSADVDKLEEMKSQLLPIANAVAGALIARIRYPGLMAELSKKHYEALCVLVNPPVIYRDAAGQPYPKTYPSSAYFVNVVGSKSMKRRTESAPKRSPYESEQYLKYLDQITIPDNEATYAFLIEMAVFGLKTEITDHFLFEMYRDYGNFAQWKAWQVIGGYCYEKGMQFPEDLLFEVCRSTNALDSPGIFWYVTEYSLNRRNKLFYPLLAPKKYQEMVRRTKVLGDPNRVIPPLPKDAPYYRYFEEIVKYVEDNSPSKPLPSVEPSAPPIRKIVKAEPQNQNAEDDRKGSTWIVVLAVLVAAMTLIAAIFQTLTKKGY